LVSFIVEVEEASSAGREISLHWVEKSDFTAPLVDHLGLRQTHVTLVERVMVLVIFIIFGGVAVVVDNAILDHDHMEFERAISRL